MSEADPPPHCPDCGAARSVMLGTLPDVRYFPGRELERPLPGGKLWHCKTCDLRFRHPQLSQATYDGLYDNAAVDVWTSGSWRVDQRLVLSIVRAAIQSRVAAGGAALRLLDFGCYTGEFLATLPGEVEKFGVDVNAKAAALAAARTGACVERSLDQFDAELRFDIIVAMDVIEHVASPRAMLSQWLDRLAPGGSVIVTTGDGSNWLWRLLGARWWYCYFPDHIAFVSERWLRTHAPTLGADVLEARRFCYLDSDDRPGFVKRWKRMLRYVLAPGAYARRQRAHHERHGNDPGVPGIGLTDDHLLLVIGRNS